MLRSKRISYDCVFYETISHQDITIVFVARWKRSDDEHSVLFCFFVCFFFRWRYQRLYIFITQFLLKSVSASAMLDIVMFRIKVTITGNSLLFSTEVTFYASTHRVDLLSRYKELIVKFHHVHSLNKSIYSPRTNGGRQSPSQSTVLSILVYSPNRVVPTTDRKTRYESCQYL